MTRVTVLVPAPDYPDAWDWAYDVEAAAMERGGLTVEPRSWTDVGDLDADLVLPLVAWGYHGDPARWHALLDRLEAQDVPVANPVPVLRWNSDKTYLVGLGDRGVPTIPTDFVEALDVACLRASFDRFGSEIVVKPPVSASAVGTYRLRGGDAVPADVAGCPMMIQPFLPAVMEEGEYSLLMFDGQYSHAVLKRPATGDYRVQPHLGGREIRCDAPDGAIAIAQRALAEAPAPPAYARVDMVRGTDGELKVIELELIEPSLWLEHAPDGGASFVAAVAKRARQ
jgi:glutathione synthase/RimK-type ligase-like ATP-grasp enzyme